MSMPIAALTKEYQVMKFSVDVIRQATHLEATAYRCGIELETNRNELNFIIRAAKVLSRIAENECNGYSYKGMETRKRNAMNLISTFAETNGLTCEFSGDPRGYVVKLHSNKPGFYNTFGGRSAGYGIG